MASKRRAESELTPDNWKSAADDQAPDGGFQRASEEELAKRTFKKAKRRLAEDSPTQSDAPAPTGLFSGFKGFSSGSATSSLPVVGESSTFKTGSALSLATTSVGLSSLAKSSASEAPKSRAGPVSSVAGSLSTRNVLTQDEYEAQLSALNASFVRWITKHHEKDPLADFTPTFDDYKNHLAKLDAKLQAAPSSSSSAAAFNSKPLSSFGGVPAPPSSSNGATAKSIDTISSSTNSDTTSSSFLPGLGNKSVTFAPVPSTDSSSSAKPGLFAFTATAAASSSATPSTSSGDGIGTSLKLSSSGITFPTSILKAAPSSSSSGGAVSGVMGLAPVSNAGSGFFSGLSTGGASGLGLGTAAGSLPSFLQAGAKKVEAGGGDEDDDDADVEKDDMEAPEFDKDADIIHSINAKLFYKKGEGYLERGVGLFKVINIDGKTQLLMRNSTRLGTILLNVMLNASMPCSRVGKNNVVLISPANPPIDLKDTDGASKPVSFLIRVKTAEDADELHKQITDRKQ